MAFENEIRQQIVGWAKEPALAPATCPRVCTARKSAPSPTLVLDALAPAENAPSVGALLEAITGEPVLCVLIAAALTWAAHSSAAVVLLVMSLAYSHFVTQIISFAINLEHIGDIIDKNLMELAVKKIKHKYEFSKEGAADLAAFHKRIIDNLKLAFSVFINDNIKIARTLIEEKTQLRTAELACADSHLGRLREGRPESIETSSLHLDVLRDLKRIHSHICSVAYPVLEAAGELQPNRLRDSEPAIAGRSYPGGFDAPQVPAQSS